MAQRISFFLPSMVDGGAERVTLNLIRYLAKYCDYQIDLILVSATGAFMDQVPSNVTIIDLGASRTLLSLPGLVRYLRTHQVDALLSGMDYVNVIALLAVKLSRTKARTVVCLHSNLSAQIESANLLRGKFITPFLRITHPWADVIVGISKGCGEDFINVTGVGRNNMRYIYNPVITDTLAPLADKPIDHPWFDAGEPPVVLAVGRLAYEKNFPLLIDAFAEVRKTLDVRLLILGDGEDREELEYKISQLQLADDVALPGFVVNPYAYMKNSALFVLSSHYEALPTALIEAMYCGTQLVAVDCPNGPREILADGKYGELVEPGNKDELVAAIVRALSMRNFAQDPEACDRFIDRNVAKQYIEALLGIETNN